MNVTLLTGRPQITQDSSLFDRLTLGGSTLLLGIVIVFAVLGIIFVALQVMRAVFTKNAIKAKQERKAQKALQSTAPKAQKPAVAPAPASAPAAAPAPSEDDTAVVAAIVAAISAYTGKAPEGFRVVSFKKRK